MSLLVGTPALNPIVMDAGSNVSAADSGGTPSGSVGPTGTPSASASEGVGSFTYLWEQTGTPAQSGPYGCSNTAILNPTWSDVCSDGDNPDTETWRLTVTDQAGQTASDTITVQLTWSDTT